MENCLKVSAVRCVQAGSVFSIALVPFHAVTGNFQSNSGANLGRPLNGFWECLSRPIRRLPMRYAASHKVAGGKGKTDEPRLQIIAITLKQSSDLR